MIKNLNFPGWEGWCGVRKSVGRSRERFQNATANVPVNFVVSL